MSDLQRAARSRQRLPVHAQAPRHQGHRIKGRRHRVDVRHGPRPPPAPARHPDRCPAHDKLARPATSAGPKPPAPRPTTSSETPRTITDDSPAVARSSTTTTGPRAATTPRSTTEWRGKATARYALSLRPPRPDLTAARVARPRRNALPLQRGRLRPRHRPEEALPGARRSHVNLYDRVNLIP